MRGNVLLSELWSLNGDFYFKLKVKVVYINLYNLVYAYGAYTNLSSISSHKMDTFGNVHDVTIICDEKYGYGAHKCLVCCAIILI